MNIYQKINEVRKDVEYLQKDKEVAGKYKAVTHDAVTALVRPRLVEQSIVTVPNLLKSATLNTVMTTGKGIPIIRYEATYRVSFINADAPEEVISCEIESHALDEGDKAPGKALSYAVKYALLKIFNIETGDDEEGRVETVAKKGKHKPTDGEWEALTPDEQTWILDLSNEVRTLLSRGDIKGACDHVDESGIDNDKRVALWSRLADVSAGRKAMKDEWAARLKSNRKEAA